MPAPCKNVEAGLTLALAARRIQRRPCNWMIGFWSASKISIKTFSWIAVIQFMTLSTQVMSTWSMFWLTLHVWHLYCGKCKAANIKKKRTVNGHLLYHDASLRDGSDKPQDVIRCLINVVRCSVCLVCLCRCAVICWHASKINVADIGIHKHDGFYSTHRKIMNSQHQQKVSIIATWTFVHVV